MNWRYSCYLSKMKQQIKKKILNYYKFSQKIKKQYHRFFFALGHVFPLNSEAELLNFTQFIKSSLQQDTLLTSGGADAENTKRSFFVDDGIGRIIISVTVSQINTIDLVTLLDPDNRTIDSNKKMELSKILEIVSPKPGLYQFIFPEAAGRYEFNVQGISEEAIEFAHSFMYLSNIGNNSTPFSMANPFEGEIIYFFGL